MVLHVPLVDDRGHRPRRPARTAASGRCRPAPRCASPSSRCGLSTSRGRHLELEVVGEPRAPCVAADLPDPGLVARGPVSRRDHAAPPLRPALGVPDRVPDLLARGLQAPGGEESRTRTSTAGLLVRGGRLAVAELRAPPLDDLREADHRDGRPRDRCRGRRSGAGSRASPRAAETRGCRARCRGARASRTRFTSTSSITAEKIFSPRAVLVADRDPDDLATLVLARLVAEPDRRRLAPALELIDEGGREEVEGEQAAGHEEASLTGFETSLLLGEALASDQGHEAARSDHLALAGPRRSRRSRPRRAAEHVSMSARRLAIGNHQAAAEDELR